MPIVFAPQGKKLRVIKILAEDKTKKHHQNLWSTIDSDRSVLSSSGCSRIVLVKDSRLALDKDLATKIFVA